jgi:hypothetical protein
MKVKEKRFVKILFYLIRILLIEYLIYFIMTLFHFLVIIRFALLKNLLFYAEDSHDSIRKEV